MSFKSRWIVVCILSFGLYVTAVPASQGRPPILGGGPVPAPVGTGERLNANDAHVRTLPSAPTTRWPVDTNLGPGTASMP